MTSGSCSLLLLEHPSADASFLQQLLIEGNADQWQIFRYHQLTEALAHLNDRTFDLALIDLSLPDGQGIECVTQFCQHSSKLPVVVLADIEDQEIVKQAIAAGAQDYLVKSHLTADLLSRTIRYAVDRNQLLTRLQNSEQRFQAAFDQTFQAMSLLTSTGVVLESNHTIFQLSGFESQTEAGLPIWQTRQWGYPPENQSRLESAVAKVASGERVCFEIQLCTAMDELIWVDFSLKPLRDKEENIVLLIAEVRDISDRKKVEIEIQELISKAKELSQMKSDFISMVSHEFRTPMTVLSTAADLLRRFDLPPERRKKYFDQIHNSVTTILQLLDDILLLGKIETGHLEFQPIALDLQAVCQEAVDVLSLDSGLSPEILFTYQGDSHPIYADPNLIHYILINLLSNAVKYSPNGGEIHLTVELQGETVTFCIRDQGIGIPKVDQEHLFEAFYRAKNVKQIQGTGLGLAIVKRCVDLHQGQIWVHSEEDQGTIFTVTMQVNLHPQNPLISPSTPRKS